MVDPAAATKEMTSKRYEPGPQQQKDKELRDYWWSRFYLLVISFVTTSLFSYHIQAQSKFPYNSIFICDVWAWCDRKYIWSGLLSPPFIHVAIQTSSDLVATCNECNGERSIRRKHQHEHSNSYALQSRLQKDKEIEGI